MFQFVLINLAFVVCALVHGACADCYVCNTQNGVACIGTRKYQNCVNGIADTSVTFSCNAANEICTENSVICMEKNLDFISPACVNTSNCGKCQGKEDDKKFICTSRSTFDTCIDGRPTGIHTICPENQLCDANLGKQKQNPCVSSDKEAQIELCEKVIDTPDEIATAESSTAANTTTTTYIGVSAISEYLDTNGETTMTTLTSAIPTTSMSTTTKLATSIPTTTLATSIPTTTTTLATSIPTTTTTTLTTSIPTTTKTTLATSIPTTTKTTLATATPTKTTLATATPTTTTFTTPLPSSSISTSTTKHESTTAENPADLVCPQQIMTGRYPHPTDTTCRSYIYCYQHRGEMKTIVYECPPFRFFNPSIRSCIPVKPDGCI